MFTYLGGDGPYTNHIITMRLKVGEVTSQLQLHQPLVHFLLVLVQVVGSVTSFIVQKKNIRTLLYVKTSYLNHPEILIPSTYGAQKTYGSIRYFHPEEFQGTSSFKPNKSYIRKLYQDISRNDQESPNLHPGPGRRHYKVRNMFPVHNAFNVLNCNVQQKKIFPGPPFGSHYFVVFLI